MDATILLVVTLALGWHLAIVWMVRSCRSYREKRPLERLLRSAELDLLGTLRAELNHIVRVEGSHKDYYRSKLKEVNSWLRRFKNVDEE